RRLPLVSLFAAANGLPVENAAFQIDPATADGRLIERGAADRAGARAGIEANQKELCDVIRSGSGRLFAQLQFTHTASATQKTRALWPGKPSLTRSATSR